MTYRIHRAAQYRCPAFLLLALAFCAVALSLAPRTALAANIDSAGNTFDSSRSPETKSQHDLYWAGQDLALYDNEVAGDVIAAGETLDVQDTAVGGSIRMAGRILDITRSEVAGNITVAGEHIAIKNGTKANGVYAAGRTVNFQGEAATLAAAGETVTISGKVDGDVNVYAGKLIIKKGAVVTGTLNAHVSEQPSKAAGAKIGKLNVDIDESSQQEDSAVFDLTGLMLSVGMALFTGIILALVLPRSVTSAGQMLHTRPLAILASGLLGLIAFIPVILIACCTIAGLQVAGVLLCVLIAVFLIAAPFAGASAACALLPQWNRFGAAALGAMVAGVLTKLPVVGGFFTFAAVILVLGYLIQSIWANMRAPRAA